MVTPPSAPLRLLHVEDVAVDSELVEIQLRRAGFNFELERTETLGEFERAIEADPVDVIISDFTLPEFDGLTALAMARERRPEVPFIFFSGTIGEERAVQTLKSGADDYVLKEHPARLASAIRNALQQRENRRLRQQAEAKVREQALILDRVTAAVFVTDLQRRIMFWNRAAERMFGRPAAAVLRTDPAEFLGATGVVLPDAATLAGRGDWQADLVLPGKHGQDEEVVVESRWSLLRDASGEPRSIFVMNTDVTAERQLERRLLRAQRLESIGALAGGVAHDLNNLLGPIMLSTQFLESRMRDPEVQPVLRTILDSARRGADLVRQILSFARGSSQEQQPIDVRQFMTDTAEFLAKVLPRNVQLEWQVSDDPAPIRGNATQVFQTIMNFAVNARDAMPEGGRLDLRAVRRTLPPAAGGEHFSREIGGEFVAISVQDSGTGIPEEVLPRLFEPFFTTKGEERGTGLGLATAAQIAENHGGCVGVISRPGEGSTFTLYLPVDQTAPPPAPAPAPAKSETGEAAAILVVDDDRAVLQLLGLILETSGYRVFTASSGVEAIRCLRENPAEVALLIADANLAGMDGPTLIRAARDLKPDLPCIGMTGDLMPSRSDWGDIVDQIEKPFTAPELLTAVGRILPPPRNPAEGTISS